MLWGYKMFIKDFAYMLQENITLPENFPVQVTLLNSSQPNGLMVMSSIGGFTKKDYSAELFFGEVELIVRHKDIDKGYEIISSIYDFLNDELNTYNKFIGDYTIKRFSCRELPISYPRNDADLYEHALICNVVFIRN